MYLLDRLMSPEWMSLFMNDSTKSIVRPKLSQCKRSLKFVLFFSTHASGGLSQNETTFAEIASAAG